MMHIVKQTTVKGLKSLLQDHFFNFGEILRPDLQEIDPAGMGREVDLNRFPVPLKPVNDFPGQGHEF